MDHSAEVDGRESSRDRFTHGLCLSRVHHRFRELSFLFAQPIVQRSHQYEEGIVWAPLPTDDSPDALLISAHPDALMRPSRLRWIQSVDDLLSGALVWARIDSPITRRGRS